MRLPAPYRRALFIGAALAIAMAGLTAFANWWIIRTTSGRIFTGIREVPFNDVALVLGTSKFSGSGPYSNPFFEGRMNAAASLFHAGKVRHLLVSGDNDRANYDEPTWMRDALIARGVPDNAITLDYAGFRTLDSMADIITFAKACRRAARERGLPRTRSTAPAYCFPPAESPP